MSPVGSPTVLRGGSSSGLSLLIFIGLGEGFVRELSIFAMTSPDRPFNLDYAVSHAVEVKGYREVERSDAMT